MICWDRRGDLVIGHFTPREIDWTRRHLTRFGEVLRIGHVGLATGADTGADSELVAEAARYAEVIAVRGETGPAATRATETVRARRLVNLLQTYDAVETVLDSLPDRGGVVLLRDPPESWAWIWAMYEYGMSLSCRLGIGWGPLPDEPPVTASAEERSFDATMRWILRVVTGLIEIADLPVPVLER
jgi:hypothetical protein